MNDYALYITTAFALIFVIEGMLYALFPGQAQKLMQMASSLPPEQFRAFGAFFAALGFLLVWLLSLAS